MSYRPSPADRVRRLAFAAMQRLPSRLVTALAGRPIVVDDEPLDPQTQLALRILDRLGAPEKDQQTLQQARDGARSSGFAFGGRPAQVGLRRELLLPGPAGPIPARLYRPAGTADPLPLVIWYHGGGWVVGDLDSHDPLARRLCRSAGVAVLSVAYRLAPEHRFPAAVDDALAAFRWAHAHAGELGAEPDRIVVAGDSAGGNLAAVVSQQTRDGGPRPAMQLLFAPAVDAAARRRSFQLFGHGFLLSAADVDWYQNHYLGPDGDPTDPRVSPLLAEDLSGLPRAYVAVAGFDPLRDEGLAYAERLRQAGVPVTLRRYGGAVHPFVNAVDSRVGRAAMADAVAALNELRQA